MPKIYLSEQEKLNDRLYTWIHGQIKSKGIRQTQIAERIGISQQVFSYRLKNRVLQVSDLLGIIALIEPDGEELSYHMGVKGNGLHIN